MRITVGNPQRQHRLHPFSGQLPKMEMESDDNFGRKYHNLKFSISPKHKRNNKCKIDLSELLSQEKRGIFSVDYSLFEDSNQQHYSKEKARLASFNIKNLIAISPNTRNSSLTKQAGNTTKKWGSIHEKVHKQFLKQYWQIYSKPHKRQSDLTQEFVAINQNMGLVVNSNLKKDHVQNESCKLESDDQKRQNRNKTTFYMKNFLKTRYKPTRHQKVRIENSPISPKVEGYDLDRKRLNARKQSSEIYPWQKSHRQTQQECFMQN